MEPMKNVQDLPREELRESYKENAYKDKMLDVKQVLLGMFMNECIESHKNSMVDLEVKEAIDKDISHFKHTI
jgi:hypothetical protein